MPGLLTRGHPAAIAAVGSMIAGPVPHAILVSGPGGVGKTTLALDLAAGLLCGAPEPGDRPCRACRGCGLVERGNHADLHRLAPSGPGDVVGIGGQGRPPGIRELVAELALLPVEGGARVAIVERADRMTEEAQSALLKTLEEPPAGVTIVLCADGEEAILPTVRSRCVRIRLGPVATREIEAILGEQGVADAPTAARLARLAGGRPGLARSWALAPGAVAARDEIGRTLVDLLDASPSRRLAVARDLLARAAEIAHGLDRAGRAPGAGPAKRGRRGPASPPPPDTAPGAEGAPPDAAPDPSSDGVDGDDEVGDADGAGPKASASQRRRAATILLAVWRDLTRDLALVELGEERRLRDPALLDDFRAAAGGLAPGALAGFLGRLERTGELLEANVGPELAVDVLLLAWPRRRAAA